MFITIISDCRDQNAIGRQATRIASLTGVSADYIGVQDDLEAAGNLIDILDASEGREGIILTNVAPRNGEAKKWLNGSPFGYFRYRETLVFSTLGGLTLSLVKKLAVTETVSILDVRSAVRDLANHGEIDQSLQEYIVNSQFRSFDFLPRVAAFLKKGGTVDHEDMRITEFPDAPQAVWFIDNFGNCKTTLLPEEIGFTAGEIAKLNMGETRCRGHLTDVPDDESSLVIGSSGLGEKRFLEIVVQGRSAAEWFNLRQGSPVL